MKRRGCTPEEDRALGLIEEGAISKVEPYTDGDGWSITYSESYGCGIQRSRCPDGIVPKVGDTLTTFGQFGYSFHGQALNGEVLWYLSPEEEEAEFQQYLAESERKRKQAFDENKAKLDADYDALPAVFKKRIDKFRRTNPDFRWDHEGYEMFCCTQAVLLAEWALDKAEGDPADALERIDAWNAINSKDHDPPYDFKAQLQAVPGWSDGHSGNTHGCAVILAKDFIVSPERVMAEHGALVPLVGCDEYGCPHDEPIGGGGR